MFQNLRMILHAESVQLLSKGSHLTLQGPVQEYKWRPAYISLNIHKLQTKIDPRFRSSFPCCLAPEACSLETAFQTKPRDQGSHEFPWMDTVPASWEKGVGRMSAGTAGWKLVGPRTDLVKLLWEPAGQVFLPLDSVLIQDFQGFLSTSPNYTTEHRSDWECSTSGGVGEPVCLHAFD